VSSSSRAGRLSRPESWITTAQLAQRLAGGDSFIRTKDGVVKGLALRLDMNEAAPEVIVVGKGPRIEASARLFVDSGVSVATYLKRAVDAWEYVGLYRGTSYRTDAETIRRHRGKRKDEVAGILFTEKSGGERGFGP